MTLCRKSPAESVILISHQMWAATYPERWYRDKRNCVVLVLQHSVARQVSIITWLYQCSVVTPARRNVSWSGEGARQECTKPTPCKEPHHRGGDAGAMAVVLLPQVPSLQRWYFGEQGGI